MAKRAENDAKTIGQMAICQMTIDQKVKAYGTSFGPCFRLLLWVKNGLSLKYFIRLQKCFSLFYSVTSDLNKSSITVLSLD
jgi:hypothetical protein